MAQIVGVKAIAGRATSLSAVRPTAGRRPLLVKSNSPRAIDRRIDCFGGDT
jgi:hypothetical protein